MSRRRNYSEMTSERLQNIVRLGKSTSIDYSKISSSTLRSVMSHIKLLEKNNFDFRDDGIYHNGGYVNATDMYRKLDNVRNSKNKLLTDDYKRQVLMTIKRTYSVYKQLDLKRYRAHGYKPPKAVDATHMNELKAMTERAAKYLKIVTSDQKITDLGIYDVCLCIMLTSSSSLRISEILQLQLENLDEIKRGVPAAIHSKASQKSRIIPLNQMLDTTIDMIIKHRPYVLNALDYLSYRVSQSISNFRDDRKDGEYIISSSMSTLRKKLREFSAIVGTTSIANLGFNNFRKFITTILIEGGGHMVAKAMNNHSDIGTTFKHYNIQTPQATEDLYRAIDHSIKERRREHDEVSSLKRKNTESTTTDDVATTSKVPDEAAEAAIEEGLDLDYQQLSPPPTNLPTETKI